MIAVMSMMLREPVANTTANLGEKIEITLLGQVPEITDQVCDGVLVNGAAALLKNRERLGGRCNVFGFLDHASLNYTIAYATGVLIQLFWQDDGARGAKQKSGCNTCIRLLPPQTWWPLRLNPSSNLVAWS
jgi:hypothetical protein